MEYKYKDIYLNYFYQIYDMIQARDGDNTIKSNKKNKNWILSVYFVI